MALKKNNAQRFTGVVGRAFGALGGIGARGESAAVAAPVGLVAHAVPVLALTVALTVGLAVMMMAALPVGAQEAQEAQQAQEAGKAQPAKPSGTSGTSQTSGKAATQIIIDDEGVRVDGERLDTGGSMEITIDDHGIKIGEKRIETDGATRIRIDDDGIRINDKRLDPGQGIVVRDCDDGEYFDEDGTRISISGKDVVRFGDDVIIDEDEVVEGDAVAIFGSVLVNGTLEGDAVAIGGNVTVGPKGRVDGDAVGIGGGVSKDPGGLIRGERVSIGKGGHWAGTWEDGRYRPFRRAFPWGFFSRGGRLFLWIAWTLVLILLGLLITAVIRRPTENICARARRDAFKMGLIGLAAWLLLGPAMAIFVVTIIGIPIGLFIIPMVFSLALLVGYTAVAMAVGERFGGGNGKSPYMAVTVGILLLQALPIIAGIIRLPGSWLGAIGFVIAVIGYAVIFVAATVGLGSVIMTKFGTAGPKPAAPVAPMQAPPPAVP